LVAEQVSVPVYGVVMSPVSPAESLVLAPVPVAVLAWVPVPVWVPVLVLVVDPVPV